MEKADGGMAGVCFRHNASRNDGIVKKGHHQTYRIRIMIPIMLSVETGYYHRNFSGVLGMLLGIGIYGKEKGT